ncbi:MAG TPA: ComEC/Rec2 family competence protein [Pyrinomonadaceae bacterium]|nr:ComEC/Rec2 family competence protein [Pyrinomonadaceae bacterium]
MGRATKGCGCAGAILVVLLIAAGFAGWKYVLPWWKSKPPPPSGGELQVHILDVGPVNGDSILIISPAGKTVLVDAGDAGKGKVVLDALKRYNVQQIDYLIATHPHPDHMGAIDEVIKATKVLNVIDNGLAPAGWQPTPSPTPAKVLSNKKPVARKPGKRPSVTRFYEEYKEAVSQSGANYQTGEPGNKFDLGGGALLTILAPSQPVFTKEQMKAGGNEPNANSIVARLDYGDFSMLLPGDAEHQTEQRMLTKDLNLQADVLKVSHHSSKYATADDFLARVKPGVAIVSCGEWNRYGHPAQVVLDRLKAAGIKLYRTDLQGEITITSRGKEDDYKITTAKEAKSDLWEGRLAQKDDSSRAGFIAYGDFGPPPKAPKKVNGK